MALSGAGEMFWPSSGEAPAAPPAAISTFWPRFSVPPERGWAAAGGAGAAAVAASAAGGAVVAAGFAGAGAGAVGEQATTTVTAAPTDMTCKNSRRFMCANSSVRGPCVLREWC